MGNPELEEKFQAFVGQQIGPPEVGRDTVNEAMIRAWCDAMGDRNPIYTDPDAAKKSAHGAIVAPPMMLQAWILPGIALANTERPPADRHEELHALFDEYGYTSPVATNSEQEFHRYLKPGDRITSTMTIESISEEKATAVGIGYFIQTRMVFTDQDGEEVGWMTFRVLKFKPSGDRQAPATDDSVAAAKPGRIRAPRGHDNSWWWEGVDRGEILIQKCSDCEELRHPPRPYCFQCQSDKWEYIMSQGAGTVYSYVVMHHPPIPGYPYPQPIALIDLEEGTRIVANIVDCEIDDIHIGMPVQGSVEEVEDGLSLPVFRAAR